MNSFFARLSPAERRFFVGVGVVVFIVVNLWWVWPHFSDWTRTQVRLANAHTTLKTYEDEIGQMKNYQTQIKNMESEGEAVPPEDQSIEFMRAIQTQAAQSSVNVMGNSGRTTRTNEFFIEQAQTITVQSDEKELVDFLYNLGAGNSSIRVRDLALRPDPPRQSLTANIKLVASYQKKTAARPAPRPSVAVTTPAKPATPTDKRP